MSHSGWQDIQGIYRLAMSHLTHINESSHTYEWVMSHIWVSPVTHMNESCHTYEWIMSHAGWQVAQGIHRLAMSHVTHMNESCHMCEWVMPHIRMSHVTHMNESCTTYEWVLSRAGWQQTQEIQRQDSVIQCPLTLSEKRSEWVMSHIWMSHVTSVSESCHTYEWVIRFSHSMSFDTLKKKVWVRHVTCVNGSCHVSHTWVSHVTYVNESCHTCEWVMSHIWMSREVQSLHVLWHCPKKGLSETCHMCEWVMSRVTHMSESCHICEWVMSHMWMSHVTYMNESWGSVTPCLLTLFTKRNKWVMSHMRMCCVTHVNKSCHICGWVMSHMWMSHVTCVSESCHTYAQEWEVWKDMEQLLLYVQMLHVLQLHQVLIGRGATVAAFPLTISKIMYKGYRWVIRPLQDTAHTLKHTTTHCNTRTATHCNTRTATHCNTRTATHCNTHKRDRWAMLHMWTSHVTYMNEPCHMCEWVMSHIWMRHVTYMNELCHIYEWVISHIWMSHVICMNESCHTYEWVMSHIWVSHITCNHVWHMTLLKKESSYLEVCVT